MTSKAWLAVLLALLSTGLQAQERRGHEREAPGFEYR